MEHKEIFYPVTVANFRKIREEGFLYIDKTSYIPKLLHSKEQNISDFIIAIWPRSPCYLYFFTSGVVTTVQ